MMEARDTVLEVISVSPCDFRSFRFDADDDPVLVGPSIRPFAS